MRMMTWSYRLMSPSPLTYMSLAGKFFPSTIRMNRELLLAMAEHTDREEAPLLRYIQRSVICVCQVLGAGKEQITITLQPVAGGERGGRG